MSDLLETIAFHAKARPASPAIIAGDAILTYGTLWDGILSVQGRLRQYGLKAGDHVAISVGSAIGHLTLICALYRAGMSSISIEPAQLEHAADLAAIALLTSDAEAKTPLRTIVVEDDWFNGKDVDHSLPNAALACDENSLCRLILSSGTTGKPKMIGLSFAAVAERLISYSIRVSTPSWQTLVCTLGLSTNYGYSFAITALWLGRTFCSALDINARNLILAHQAEVLVASTHQIAALVQFQEQQTMRLDSLRAVHIGGAVAYAPLQARIRMQVCSNVYCGYGSTEGGTVAYVPAELIFGMDRAVGITVPWVTMEVVDEHHNKQDYGKTGEMRLKALGQGYRYSKAANGGYDVDRSEWFYPGDMATHFRNGLLTITGRVNEMINRGGLKVAPETVEEQIKKHPNVADAAAVGVLDDIGIEQIWVGIVSSDGSEADIKKMFDYCRAEMPLCIPDRIFQVPSIPRNQLGKVSRVPLTEQLKTLEKNLALTLR